MALDRNYFNSIRLDPIKRKFYDVYAVDNLLVDIRRQAELMNHRYEELRAELEDQRTGKEDYRQKGQALSEEIVALREALKAAEQRAVQAEEKASVLERETAAMAGGRNTDNAPAEAANQPEIVEEMYDFMKKTYMSGLQALEEQWQAYLEHSSSPVPEDLSRKISKIANVLQEINEKTTE